MMQKVITPFSFLTFFIYLCRMKDLSATHILCSPEPERYARGKKPSLKAKIKWICEALPLRWQQPIMTSETETNRERERQWTKRAADEKMFRGAPHRLMDYPFERIYSIYPTLFTIESGAHTNESLTNPKQKKKNWIPNAKMENCILIRECVRHSA